MDGLDVEYGRREKPRTTRFSVMLTDKKKPKKKQKPEMPFSEIENSQNSPLLAVLPVSSI